MFLDRTTHGICYVTVDVLFSDSRASGWFRQSLPVRAQRDLARGVRRLSWTSQGNKRWAIALLYPYCTHSSSLSPRTHLTNKPCDLLQLHKKRLGICVCKLGKPFVLTNDTNVENLTWVRELVVCTINYYLMLINLKIICPLYLNMVCEDYNQFYWGRIANFN